MSRSILFVVTSDPRSSARPAEAIRIAAGVGAWKQVDVRLLLHGAAALALGESPEEWVDADHFIQYLPIIRDLGRPVYLEKGNAFLNLLGQPICPIQELTQTELATLTAQCEYVTRF
ncbi:MAG: hypothetical protein FJ398_14715 [Verrucomicrobia bacterium]|nr:hypothetical protein [Verrucomicrobiota bacterium]